MHADFRVRAVCPLTCCSTSYLYFSSLRATGTIRNVLPTSTLASGTQEDDYCARANGSCCSPTSLCCAFLTEADTFCPEDQVDGQTSSLGRSPWISCNVCLLNYDKGYINWNRTSLCLRGDVVIERRLC